MGEREEQLTATVKIKEYAKKRRLQLNEGATEAYRQKRKALLEDLSARLMSNSSYRWISEQQLQLAFVEEVVRAGVSAWLDAFELYEKPINDRLSKRIVDER